MSRVEAAELPRNNAQKVFPLPGFNAWLLVKWYGDSLN